MTDFRALCVELTDCLEKADWPHKYRVVFQQWTDISRAALAEQPVGPTDEELDELFTEIDQSGESESWRAFARAVLARWGQPAVTLIPVAERLPGPEDCDANGRCWLLFRSASMKMTPVWSLVQSRSIFDGPYTYWLPSNALQVPADV